MPSAGVTSSWKRAARCSFGNVHDGKLQTFAIAETLIHSPKIACENSSFIATCTRTDFKQYVFIVVWIFWNQQFFDIGIQAFDFRTQFVNFHLCQVTQLLILRFQEMLREGGSALCRIE